MDLERRLHGEEMGGVEEGKTIIRICYVRKKSILNEKGKEEEGAEEEKEKEKEEEEEEKEEEEEEGGEEMEMEEHIASPISRGI